MIDTNFERKMIRPAFTMLQNELNSHFGFAEAIILHPLFMDKLLKEQNQEIISSKGIAGYCYKADQYIKIYVSSDNLTKDQIKII